MKKSVIIIILSLLVIECIAQVRPARRRHFRTFQETTTLVVLYGNPFSSFNERFKEEMDRFWTITPYEFITYDEFRRKRSNDNYSFLILAEIKQQNVPHVYKFINFVLGDTERDFNRMPDLGSVPLKFKDAGEYTYLYKLGAFVQFMQNNAIEGSSRHSFQLTRLINVRDERLHEMELWLLKDELAPEINTVEKINEHYPYTVKLVTTDDIQNAITEQRKDVAFLHKIGPEGTLRQAKCWKFIITTSGEVLYSNDHDVNLRTPDALLKEDLEIMAKK